jgi:methionyl-tRNA synthetase
MIARNCGGGVPAAAALTGEDRAILLAADDLLPACRSAMETQQIHLALNAVFAVVAEANRYFAAAAPWELKKSDPARMEAVLWVTAEIVRQAAILLQPVMPAAAGKLLDLLAVPAEARGFAALGEAGRLTPGVALPPPQGVFPRYVDKDAAAS